MYIYIKNQKKKKNERENYTLRVNIYIYTAYIIYTIVRAPVRHIVHSAYP